MNYWLDLLTGTTWQEFQTASAGVSGFREHNWNRARNIKPGDVFLCYLVGVKRWVGLLEVMSERYRDEASIWGEEVFPVRFKVKPLVVLKPEHGVPMEEFKGKLSFYELEASPGRWSGWVRSSPTKYKKGDGDLIAAALRNAETHPVARPVDPNKLKRSSNLYKVKGKGGEAGRETVVAVPRRDDEEESATTEATTTATHTEIQWRLLDLGSQMGLNVWAPKADRGKTWNGNRIDDVPQLLDALPTQFDEATNNTIENIDVLWISSNAIAAAFEVEHTTSIYSGLLRMSDLLTMQPNIDLKLYLVAPDERYPKFRREVPRPTFASRRKPLHSICGFLSYSKLCQRLEEVKNVFSYLKPDFVDDITEFYDPAEEFDA
ncbi:MAG: EVE domain-containing protein [Phycisphaerae bacterium]